MKQAVALKLLCCAWLLSACSASNVDSPPETSAAPSSDWGCDENLEARALRMGSTGNAALLYDCSGSACSGNERFARGVDHAISLEVMASAESVLTLESETPSIAEVTDVVSAFDPCAGKTRVWATLEAREPGATQLVVRDAVSTLDRVALAVADPAFIRLRATQTGAFAFNQPDGLLEGTTGQSWMIAPELFDETRVLIVGAPPLTWEVEDPHVVELRAETVDAGSAAELPATTATLEAKSAGETNLRVSARSGAQTSLQFRVTPSEP